MKASELIVDAFPVLKNSDTGKKALAIMNEYHVDHLPVVNENKLTGLISEEQILNAHAEELTVSQIPAAVAFPFVKNHEHLFEVVKVVMELHLSVIPVLDKEENYLGSITKENLLNYFVTGTDVMEPGGILVLELHMKDFLLSEIIRIIETADARIICVFTGSNADSGKIDITIKVNQTDLQHVVATLQRYNYEVKETFREPEYIDVLKDRYDSLMNYLDI